MKLAEQWGRIEQQLPSDWEDALLALDVQDEAQRRRAGALLGPATPGQSASRLRFHVRPGGGAVGPDAARRLLARIDAEGIRGTLELAGTTEAAPAETRAVAALADAWDNALAELPADWSDAYCEVSVESSDLLDRAALLMAPINPARVRGRNAFRFRAARQAGYGASPGMARRCLSRVDDDGIRGGVEVLRALSGTELNDTQGPVWYLEGKSV
jgi:hypothetical protein